MQHEVTLHKAACTHRPGTAVRPIAARLHLGSLQMRVVRPSVVANNEVPDSGPDRVHGAAEPSVEKKQYGEGVTLRSWNAALPTILAS